MWKIIDLNKKVFLLVEENKNINIGNIENCDIKLEVKSEKKILTQFFLESEFIYCIHNKKIKVHFQKQQLSIFEKCPMPDL